jgi:hypothetical protein
MSLDGRGMGLAGTPEPRPFREGSVPSGNRHMQVNPHSYVVKHAECYLRNSCFAGDFA